MIIELVGYPTEEELQSLSDCKEIQLLRNLPKTTKATFEDVFSGASLDAIDLLKKMLTFDPKQRISATEALDHPYLAALSCIDDEPTTEPVSEFDFEFEIYDL